MKSVEINDQGGSHYGKHLFSSRDLFCVCVFKGRNPSADGIDDVDFPRDETTQTLSCSTLCPHPYRPQLFPCTRIDIYTIDQVTIGRQTR